MDKLPLEIHSSYIENFPNVKRNYVTASLRETVYKHLLLRANDNDYVDLDKFVQELDVGPSYITEIVADIRKELRKLGWKTALSYNDTGLFIFSGDKPPSCW